MAGDGTLFQRKSDSKCYFIYNTGEKTVKGKYKQKWIDLETTDKNAAKEKIKLLRADLVKKGRIDEPSKQTFGEWLTFWLNEVEKPKIEESTYDFYEGLIRVHIKPKLGLIPLKELQPETLQRFFNQKRTEKKLSQKKDIKGNYIPTDKPISSRTVKGIADIVTMALNKAVGMRKIPENPLIGLDRIKHKNPEVKYMTSEQVIEFLEKVRYDPWYALFVTDLGTGLRRGEIAALKWDNVDLENKIIRVENSRVKVNTYAEEGPKSKIITKDTKTEKGKRTVPLPDDVVIALKKWKQMQIQDMWAWEQKRLKEQALQKAKPWKKPKRKHPRPVYQKSGYVFTHEDGRPVTPGYLSKYFLKLMKKHGYEGLTFHKQRHSYVSMLLEAGTDMKVIQENLGDATLKIVADTYAHVAEKLKRQAANKLNGFTKSKAN
jgi:integrase